MSATVVFYCPLKAPDLEASSGVPRVAGLFVAALEQAGYRVEVPDLPLTYDGKGDVAGQRACREAAARTAEPLIARMRERTIRLAAWFTYHCYYKSPDMIGAAVSQALGCPYLIAEGSVAQKRAIGPWAEHHAAAVRALSCADVLLAATGRDREGLESLAGRRGKVVGFPPFVDCARFAKDRPPLGQGRVRILTAGSMNDARKIESYRRLFEALRSLRPTAVYLTIAGDGTRRPELEHAAMDLRAKGFEVRFLGEIPHGAMPDFFASGDIFAWPGVGEAYGLTYLEAQAAGLPVVAEDYGGVSACVRNGVSGVLTDPNSEQEFSHALASLMADATRRRELGRSARAWVQAERSLTHAARRLREIIGEAHR